MHFTGLGFHTPSPNVQPLILDWLPLVDMLLFLNVSYLFAGKLITLEAMSGLSKVLLYLDKKNVHLLVVYIFMKIKPFLESVCFISIFQNMLWLYSIYQKTLPYKYTYITLIVYSGSVLIQENDEIRCASIHLMGNLSKFGSGEPVFKDQIHNVLVSLLLHLADPNPQVVKVGTVHIHKHKNFQDTVFLV